MWVRMRARIGKWTTDHLRLASADEAAEDTISQDYLRVMLNNREDIRWRALEVAQRGSSASRGPIT